MSAPAAQKIANNTGIPFLSRLRRPSRGQETPLVHGSRNPFRPVGEKHSFQKSRMITLLSFSLCLEHNGALLHTRATVQTQARESNISARHRVIPTRLSIIAIAGCINIGLKGFTVIVFTARTQSILALSIPWQSAVHAELSLLERIPVPIQIKGLWWISFETNSFSWARRSSMRRDNRFAGVFGITGGSGSMAWLNLMGR